MSDIPEGADCEMGDGNEPFAARAARTDASGTGDGNDPFAMRTSRTEAGETGGGNDPFAGGSIDPFSRGALRTGTGIPCPYGLNHLQYLDFFRAEKCDEGLYEAALARGWRRSGSVFYRNRCGDGCMSCIPIRLDANALAPTKSQRHAIRANADLKITISPASFTREDFDLFGKYLDARHCETAPSFDEDEYYQAYIQSPVETVLARYRTAEGKLVAVSYLDSLPGGLSSVYFTFDPDEGRRSLGTYSVFAETDLLRAMGKRWYYLGFWVQGCAKMSYKANFRPFETAREGVWTAGKQGTQ